MKNTHGGVKLQVSDRAFVIILQLFTYFKLYKWYQIVQSIVHNQPAFNSPLASKYLTPAFNTIDIVLVSLLLTLDIFHTLL